MQVGMLEVGPIGTNCYILMDEVTKSCAVIDPGDEGYMIAATVEKSGCKPCAVFLTHGHHDHTDGVAVLQEKWPDVPVYMSLRDDYSNDPRMMKLFPPLKNLTNYDDGDVISVGSLNVEVMATPGHSLGSVTLRCGEVLFCGDTLFAGSCGRTDFPGGSMQTILESLKRLGELEGNYQVCPGHMSTSNLDWERQNNPYLKRAMR